MKTHFEAHRGSPKKSYCAEQMALHLLNEVVPSFLRHIVLELLNKFKLRVKRFCLSNEQRFQVFAATFWFVGLK